MEFTLQHHNLMRTTFYTPDSIPLYTTHTDRLVILRDPTTIKKYLVPQNQSAPISAPMADVEIHALTKDVVSVWGQEVSGLHRSIMTHGIEFTGPDGKKYKWKHHFGGDWSLVSASSSGPDLAYLDAGLTMGIPTRRATLRIHPDVLDILDQIIATLVYAEKRYKKSRNTAVAANAAV